jgi:hypothetical protein
LQRLRTCYRAPFAPVQRAQLLLWAHRHPQWQNAPIAQRVGGRVNTGQRWRQRWPSTDSLPEAPRAGTRSPFTPRQRAQVVALACSTPRQYDKPWPRWAGEKRVQGAVEQRSVATISPGTSRRWLRADQLKPGRYPCGQHATDPQVVEKATPVLALYAQAPPLQAHGELPVCTAEKPSIQARPRVTTTKAPAPGAGVQVADRYNRMGARQLFCAVVGASGVPFGQTRLTTKCADCKAFWGEFWRSPLGASVKVVPLRLANGPTHAPKPLGTWLASLELAFEGRLYWLPKYARWLAQVDLIFRKVHRDVLTPNDFPSLLVLEKTLHTSFAELTQHPKPLQWTYTTPKLLAKFGAPPPLLLAA